MLNDLHQESSWKRFKESLKWENASPLNKTIRWIVILPLLYWAYETFKYEGDVTFSVYKFDGSVVEVVIREGCGKILDKAANGRELTEEEVKKLKQYVPREDAELVYSALRVEWYKSKGWQQPALSLRVMSDSSDFVSRYYE